MYFMNNDYTIGEIVKMGYSFILTKLFNRDATLIRRPFYIRGKQRCRFGKGFSTGYRCRIETFGERGERDPKLVIKENTHIGDDVHIAAAKYVEIGKNCLFASKILVTDLDHGFYSSDGGGSYISSPDSDPNSRPLNVSPVVIGDNVWLGDNVCVLKGVHIGDGCVIASNSVVTRDIEPGTIAAGSPAKAIKRYDGALGKWVSVG